MSAEVSATLSPPVRHGRVVRITHWLNALAVFFLLMTGLNIFNAHPRLYWGDAGSVDQRSGQWLEIGAWPGPGGMIGAVQFGTAGPRIETTGVLGLSRGADGRLQPIAYPGWATFPSRRDLATARNWHFFMAWLLVLNGIVALVAGLVSGHVRHDLLPRRGELAPRHIWADIVAHLKLRFPTGAAAHDYQVLQKLAYAGVALVLIPLMILTGLAMSPGANAILPWLPDILGGRQSARSVHWIAANLVLLFIIVHLVMVVLSGPIGQIRSMITGRTGAVPAPAE